MKSTYRRNKIEYVRAVEARAIVAGVVHCGRRLIT